MTIARQSLRDVWGPNVVRLADRRPRPAPMPEPTCSYPPHFERCDIGLACLLITTLHERGCSPLARNS